MREKLARWLRTYKLDEVEVVDPSDDGIVPWDKCSQETRDYWLRDAAQLTLIFKEMLDGMKIAKPELWKKESLDYHAGYYRAEQDLLKAIKEECDKK